MSDGVKNDMESKIGSDFSNVKIHTDSRAVQMSQEIGAQAFTNGDHIYFNNGKYAPGNAEGKHLLVHELAHVVQHNGTKKSIQRKLTVEDDYPQAYVDFALKKPRGRDNSKDLSNTERLSYVTVLFGKLSPHFNVDSGGQVKPSGDKKESDLAKDTKATASCCLHVLTRKASTTDWKILVADHLSPHTFEEKASVLINSEISPVGFGRHTETGAKHMYDKGQVILGHELCGHASLMELGAHPEGARAVTNVHDPTIKIENEIAKEIVLQGDKYPPHPRSSTPTLSLIHI